MTTVNGTSGTGPIRPQNNGTPVHTKKAEEIKTATPIQITGSDTVKRADLDNISPYAALGVNFSQPNFAARVEKEAQAMFPEFTGQFKLNNPEQAVKDLANLNIAINLRTPKGVKQFLADHLNGNPKEVAKNIADKNGDFADLFA